ncbi:hypothetical protein QE11421_14845 [Escherichia coli]|nr:hypothetical protein QE11421_14845 [Escherichia coli]BED50478.1 hypothetical protein VEE48_17120 [Escherichia coli]
MQITNMHCSGQTVSLAAGDYHATIVTVGAGLAELTFQGCHGNDSNLLIVFYVQIMPDDFVMQLHRF